MPEAVRRKVDKMLRGLTPKHQRQLSVSSSNALDRFSVVETVLQHRKLVLLLDYDGTLTPIVNDPSKAVLSERVRSILRELPKHFITGVISGRSLGKIRSFVGVPGLFYAGSHGFDILAPSHPGPAFASKYRIPKLLSAEQQSAESTASQSCSHNETTGSTGAKNGKPCMPDGDSKQVIPQEQEIGVSRAGPGDVLEEVRHQVAAEYLPLMSTIKDQLIAGLKGINRAEVEDNRFSISIHYRNCAREDVPKVKEVVMGVQARFERIRMGSGKEVFELQPDIAWDKGKAVLWLLDKLVMPMAESTAPVTDTVAANGGAYSMNANHPDARDSVVGEKSAATDAHTEGVDEDEGEEDVSDDGQKSFFTIFIGDDKTDENAFRVLTGECPGSAGHEGLGILVSEESRETNAAYTLRNPDEVALFLEKIATFGSQRCCSTRRWR